MVPDHDHGDVREPARRLCERFPGESWRRTDAERAYPHAFVKELTEAGYLPTLIPEAYRGAGLCLSAAAIPGENQRAGCNGVARHAQRYVMGIVPRPESTSQETAANG